MNFPLPKSEEGREKKCSFCFFVSCVSILIIFFPLSLLSSFYILLEGEKEKHQKLWFFFQLVLVEPFLFAVLYSENFGVSFVFGAFELIKFIGVEEGKWQEEELHHHLSRKSFSHILWKISYQMFHTASQVHHPGVSLLLHWNHFFGQNMGIFFSAPYFHGWLWIGNVIMLLHWSIWFLSIFWKNSLRSLFFFLSLCMKSLSVLLEWVWIFLWLSTWLKVSVFYMH